MRFGSSQKRPAGPHGTRPEAAGSTGTVLAGPASSVPRLRPAAPLAAPVPGFCRVVDGVPSPGEPLAEGRLGSVTVVVSPAPLPLLPALLVPEGLVVESPPLLGVFESSLELPQPVRAQSKANTHGSARSAAPGHSRVCPLRAERREAPRIAERFIVYSHCAIARAHTNADALGRRAPAASSPRTDRASRGRNGSGTPTFAPVYAAKVTRVQPRSIRSQREAERAFNRNARSGSLCAASSPRMGQTLAASDQQR